MNKPLVNGAKTAENGGDPGDGRCVRRSLGMHTADILLDAWPKKQNAVVEMQLDCKQSIQQRLRRALLLAGLMLLVFLLFCIVSLFGK